MRRRSTSTSRATLSTVCRVESGSTASNIPTANIRTTASQNCTGLCRNSTDICFTRCYSRESICPREKWTIYLQCLSPQQLENRFAWRPHDNRHIVTIFRSTQFETERNRRHLCNKGNNTAVVFGLNTGAQWSIVILLVVEHRTRLEENLCGWFDATESQTQRRPNENADEGH